MKKILQFIGLGWLVREQRQADSDTLAAAKHFRNVVGQCAFGKKMLTMTIDCDGYVAQVCLAPDDGLIQYMFQWAQGITFQVAAKGKALTNAPGQKMHMDEREKKDVEDYLKWWGKILTDNGEHPVVMISRREPGVQRLMICPGYSKDMIDMVIDIARSQNKDTMTEIEML